MLVEGLKRNADDFGGFQPNRLSPVEIRERWCCAQFCAQGGSVQIPVPGGFRIVCGRHAVLLHLITLGVLGDPSPIPEIQDYAEKLGVDWESILKTEPIHPTLPENFSCLRCGGRYHVEKIGMFKGSRYIHNCGE